MYDRFFPRFSSVLQTANMEELEVAGERAFGWGLVLVPRAGGPRIEMERRA
jgi:hypothetical protein